MKQVEEKSAIILAMFGTSEEEALPGLFNIRVRMTECYPFTQVCIAFTSGIIRRIWRERAVNEEYRLSQPHLPEEVFHIRGPLGTITRLGDSGYTTLVVQPVHMVPAEEYRDLCAAVETLAASRILQHRTLIPLRLAVGRPALGLGDAGDHSGGEVVAAARALAADVELARSRRAALLYMGHGSKRFSAGPIYQDFVEAMRGLYPDVLTAIALVEGSPSVPEALQYFRRHGVQRLLLKPLMVSAGRHARQDMTGPPPRGWQSLLAVEGFMVEPILRGLGEHDPFAAIFVRHAAAAAERAGIILR
jgi:sirohydrochlorin cobaltochelatase